MFQLQPTLVKVRFVCGTCGDEYETQVELGLQVEILNALSDHPCAGRPDEDPDGGEEITVDSGGVPDVASTERPLKVVGRK